MEGIQNLANVSALCLDELREPASLVLVTHALQLGQGLFNDLQWYPLGLQRR